VNDRPLVLSLFPGIGLLDMAFELEGFCVVRGPDLLWGGDVKRFHPPAGKFDGVIGGPPCQAFSRLAHMVRQNGYQPKFGNLIPEFERCVSEAQPLWFVMEEVPDAPAPAVRGYNIDARLLNNRWLGETSNRLRRISFGTKADTLQWMPLPVLVEALMSSEFEYAAVGGNSAIPIAIGGSGKVKAGRRVSPLPQNNKTVSAFRELVRKQGLSDDFDLPPFTVTAKCQALGNGVPIPMGRAIARAVKQAIGYVFDVSPEQPQAVAPPGGAGSRQHE
jgi:DNA (cytosine-5)-methyltransferase 1